jgi:hypothetical protein
LKPLKQTEARHEITTGQVRTILELTLWRYGLISLGAEVAGAIGVG